MATISTHKFFGRALIAPGTFSKEKNSVDIVFASEEPVMRPGWYIGIDGNYNEVLSCDPKNIRTQRSDQGLPLFMDHDSGTLLSQLGKVTNIQYKNGQATGTVVFGARMDEAMKTDIENGIISSFSIGYQIYSLQEVKSSGDNRTFVADDWEPLEVSLVGVPADPNAKTRQNDDTVVTKINDEKIDEKMNIKDIQEKGTLEQRERLANIKYVVRSKSLSDDEIQSLFDSSDKIEDIEKRYANEDNTRDLQKINKLLNI